MIQALVFAYRSLTIHTLELHILILCALKFIIAPLQYRRPRF